MSTTPPDPSLDALLGKLRQGDATAAAELFFTYEPTLRMIVRRQLSSDLRAKFDSADIVQSVWADVLQGFRDGDWSFVDASKLRGFLVTATRNRFIDRYRQHRTAMDREQRFGDGGAEASLPSRQPRPSEEAQANDLWQRMLAVCPPQHHALLELKRQGLQLNEIAERTDLHPSSIRRILYDLARKLAFSDQGDPSAGAES